MKAERTANAAEETHTGGRAGALVRAIFRPGAGEPNAAGAPRRPPESLRPAPCAPPAPGQKRPARLQAALTRTAAPARHAAAGLLLAFAALLALPLQAQAQTAATLVSNIGQDFATNGLSSFIFDLRQGFTTGTNTAGYTLGSVDIRLVSTSPNDVSGSAIPTVSIVQGTPTGTVVATLMPPASLTANTTADYTFTAPVNTTLTAMTTYYVVIEFGVDTIAMLRTILNEEDSGGESDWSIADDLHWRPANSTGNFMTADEILLIAVKGTTSSDASLSALALAESGSATISLTPGFATVTTTYTASVANGIDTVTLTASNDSNATVVIMSDDDTTSPGVAELALNVGSNTLTVTVTAEDGTTEQEYTITVTRAGAVTDNDVVRLPPPPPTNTPPVVANPLADQEATTGASFTYVIPAAAFTDADGTTLAYTATLSDGGLLPAWLTFDPATRTFTGTPGPGDGGPGRVKVTASDGTATVSDDFVLMVTVRNTPPEVANSLADQEVMVDVPFTYVVPAAAFTDADGDPLTYTVTTRDDGGLPGWLTFDPDPRTFTGTPAASDSGPVFVTVTASDGTATVSDEFVLRVLMVAPSTLRAWTSRFGRTVATHVTDAVGERLRASPEQDSQVTVGGYRLPLGRQAAGGGGPETTTDSETTDPETATDRLASLLTGLVGRALGLGPAHPQGGGPGTDLWAAPPAADPRLGPSQTLQLPMVRLRDVLLGSSFRLALGDDDAASGHLRLTAWGRVAGTQFNGRDGDLTLDGDVLTGTVGVDSVWDRWLAGVAVSHSLGGGSFTGDGDGDLDSSTLTSIHPYLRYAVNERVDVWGVLGYGWGDMTLEPGTGGTLETDTTLLMGAFGGRGILLSAPDNAGFQLAARTDAMLTRTTSGAVAGLAETEADAHRLRLVLEGTRPVLWPEGQSVTPTVELGVRHDWGDAETGFGLELGGRVQYADPTIGLTIEAAVRGLLTHEDSDYKEWGASGTIRLAPDLNGQGLSLTLAPTWGAASSGVDGLWTRQTTAGLAPQGVQAAPTGRLNAEIGYGVAAPFGPGLLTPYAGTVLTDSAARAYRLGTRWTSESGLTLNLEVQRQEPAAAQPVNQGLQLQVGWGF